MAKIGKYKGWVLTSVVMAIVHIAPRMIEKNLNPADAVLDTILIIPPSLLMGYMFLRTRSIVASGVFHTLVNWQVVLMRFGGDS